MNTTTRRRPIPVHFQAGPGTACMRLITPSARICHTQDREQVSCGKCRTVLRGDQLAAEIAEGVLSAAFTAYGITTEAADRAALAVRNTNQIRRA